MRIEIDLKKSLEQNAASFFEKSKKAKRKLESLERALAEMERKAAGLREKIPVAVEKKTLEKKRKREWFEKFHWFFSSDGFLVLAGRDAAANEQLIKKHLEKCDLFFHADIHGAAHCVLKAEGKKVPQSSLEEAAVFAAVFSRAWQQGLASVDVYSAAPEQLSKAAPSGEAIGKGAFMVFGERKWFKKTPLRFSVGIRKEDGGWRVVSGPESALKESAAAFVSLLPGGIEKGALAKKICSVLLQKLPSASIDIDDLLSMLPSGASEIVS
jgi:predicted ribosome quality control (RQC) complex YloA/Tae2 family protein